jgi:iron complex outermembrane recepter protein
MGDIASRHFRLPRSLSRAPRRLATVPSAVCLILATQGALAADGPAPAPAQASSDALQEVVVTAQFRSENLQTTPLAISAISADQIAARAQSSLVDITKDAPSVQLNTATGAFGPSITAYIRGIGQGDLDPALEPGVGIYVDDVYFATLTGAIFDLLDLDRVEVLRGPQGTLEGMNSEGGAVKMFSKKPDATQSANVDVTVGSRNHVEVRAGSNFALTDNLFVRLSAVGNHQDGYVTRYDFGCSNPTFQARDINGVSGTYSVVPGFLAQTSNCELGKEGGTGYAAARLGIRWLASDNLEFNFIGDISNTNQDHPAETLLYAGPGVPSATAPQGGSFAATHAASLAIPARDAQGAQHLLPFDSAYVPALIPPNFYSNYQNFCLPAVTTPVTIPGLGSNANNPAFCVSPRQTIQSWGAQLATDLKISDTLSLKNIVAFRGYGSQWVHDNDISIWDGDLGAESMGHHQFSEELRLNGSMGHWLDYTLGGFYFREMTVYFGHEDLWYAISAFPGIFNFYQNDPIQAHNKAGFLHTTFHVTNKFDVILGARYTQQDKTYTYIRLNPQGTTGGSATLVSGLNGYTAPPYRAHRWDWRANLNYQINDEAMVYGQLSTGFKGGGVDPRPFYAPQAVAFAPESLTTYEFGLKTNWFDNHLHANIDGYFSVYHDIQLTLANCSAVPAIAAASAAAGINYGSPCALPYNAGSAHQKGVEFESQLRFGGFQADMNAAFLKFEYTYLDPNSGISLGMVTPQTPKWSGGAGVQYTWELGDHGSLTARGDGNTRSEIWSAAVNTNQNRIPGFTTYGAHLTWQASKSNWQVALHGENVTAKKYYIAIFDLSTAGQGTVGGVPGRPMEYDLEVKHQF